MADQPEVADTFTFHHNLERRVQNLALGPRTPSNALVPVFEAIYNAIHSIEDRFGEDWAEKSNICIDLDDFGSGNPSIRVTDNGCGINGRNFESFRTYDSDYKSRRGGKGVGRLTWLKVFEDADIQSVFHADGDYWERRFRLILDNDGPIKEHELKKTSVSSLGTSVLLRNMKSAYSKNMPTKNDTILRKMIAHFLPYFVAERKPKVVVSIGGESFNLSTYFENSQKDYGEVDFEVGDGVKLKLQHNMLEKGVVDDQSSHIIFFCANGRVVREQIISNALGLNTSVEIDGQRFTYAGVVSGDFLDEAVNAERTSFDMDAKFFEAILRQAIDQIRVVLHDQIERVISRQAALTKGVISKYPRFSYLVGDPQDFARHNLPRNLNSVEQVYQQLSVLDFRENRSLERRVEAASREFERNEDAIEGQVSEILNRLTNQELSSLADYTVRRKVLLDLLEKRLGYRPDGQMKHHAEEALHEFVVPMRATNYDVHIDNHNLWIIDDRLAYYEHWASDKAMKKTIQESSSAVRPDVVLFGGRTAFHRPGTDQPVVVIEFKKPARDDYTDDENPFSQIFSYIDEMRSGKARDRNGGVIQEILDDTPFFCYIIADLTPKLKSWANMAQINVPLPGGSGFYGYNQSYRAFIQVLSYKYVVKDARLRNEAFFKTLSI